MLAPESPQRHSTTVLKKGLKSRICQIETPPFLPGLPALPTRHRSAVTILAWSRTPQESGCKYNIARHAIYTPTQTHKTTLRSFHLDRFERSICRKFRVPSRTHLKSRWSKPHGESRSFSAPVFTVDIFGNIPSWTGERLAVPCPIR